MDLEISIGPSPPGRFERSGFGDSACGSKGSRSDGILKNICGVKRGVWVLQETGRWPTSVMSAVYAKDKTENVGIAPD